MELNAQHCYRAMAARDARFDGRFYVGVLTTGIYCRPVCPARTPKARNVRFYPSAAAASEAGFRPCLRCRPETSPGTPAWSGTSATVARALRLISEGALDDGDVTALADRLGVGDRHLRRLFREQLGASPVSIAQTRRLHFAKQLLDQTRLPMTQVALASGYSSVRRFNTAIRSAYGVPPSTLRKKRSNKVDLGRSPAGKNGAPGRHLELVLNTRGPHPLDVTLRFLAARAIPGVEEVTAHVYRRSVAATSGEESGVVEISASDSTSLRLQVEHALSADLSKIVAQARRLFDLDADPAAIRSALARDPVLAAPLRRTPGLRVPGAWDGFEIGVRAILGQQVSVARATSLSGTLVQHFGTRLDEPRGEITHLFPSAERLADADVSVIGLPAVRAKAIRALARAVVEGNVDLEAISDLERGSEHLTTLPGIGPWTAAYIAMRALREPDAFPAGDLVLRRAASPDATPLGRAQLEARAEAWRPWRAYAAMALWHAST